MSKTSLECVTSRRSCNVLARWSESRPASFPSLFPLLHRSSEPVHRLGFCFWGSRLLSTAIWGCCCSSLACVAGSFPLSSVTFPHPLLLPPLPPGRTPMSDRASSASFRLGPPSPSSPAAGFLKESHSPFLSSDQLPQTPASPPLMSVSAQNHAINITSSQASFSQATSQSTNLSSPPSSVPMSAQVFQQATLSTTDSFPTPASSVSGHLENSDKATGIEIQESGPTAMADSNAELTQSAEHRRSDHDRQLGGTDPGTGGRDSANMDSMDVDTNNEAAAAAITSSENSGPGLDSLQREFTSAYHLCKSCKSSPISILATGLLQWLWQVCYLLGLKLLTLCSYQIYSPCCDWSRSFARPCFAIRAWSGCEICCTVGSDHGRKDQPITEILRRQIEGTWTGG